MAMALGVIVSVTALAGPFTLSGVLEAILRDCEVRYAHAAHEWARADGGPAGYRGELSLSVRPLWQTAVPGPDAGGGALRHEKGGIA